MDCVGHSGGALRDVANSGEEERNLNDLLSHDDDESADGGPIEEMALNDSEQSQRIGCLWHALGSLCYLLKSNAVRYTDRGLDSLW